MLLPALDHWTTTRVALHQAAQVVGAVRATVADPEPNYTHLGLRTVPEGLTTGRTSAGELLLDFHTLTILITAPDGKTQGVPLESHTQGTLADAVEAEMAALGHSITLKRDKLTGTAALEPEVALAADYLQVLTMMSALLERLYAELPDRKTPVLVWPHGFDMSFLWFATEAASEHAPHMSFGFSPYSAGLERPYLYTYAYPIPDGLARLPLPEPAHWHTQGWTGTVLPYDRLRELRAPEPVIEHYFREVFQTVASRLV